MIRLEVKQVHKKTKKNQRFSSDHQVYPSISSVNLDSFIEYSCTHDAHSTKNKTKPSKAKAAATTTIPCKQIHAK